MNTLYFYLRMSILLTISSHAIAGDLTLIAFKHLKWNQKIELCDSLRTKFNRNSILIDSFMSQSSKSWINMKRSERYQACYGVSNILKVNYEEIDKEKFNNWLSSEKLVTGHLKDAKTMIKDLEKRKVGLKELIEKAVEDLEKSLVNVDYSEKLLKASKVKPSDGYMYYNLLRNIELRKNIVANNTLILNSILYYHRGNAVMPNKGNTKR